jgi:hypothetical protein
MQIVNPFVLCVGLLQVVGGCYSAYTGYWRMAIINVCVGVANALLSTLKS